MTWCEEKFRYGNDRAAANVDVDDDEFVVGDVGPAAEPLPDPFFGVVLFNCRAFANAFSCVRTK